MLCSLPGSADVGQQTIDRVEDDHCDKLRKYSNPPETTVVSQGGSLFKQDCLVTPAVKQCRSCLWYALCSSRDCCRVGSERHTGLVTLVIGIYIRCNGYNTFQDVCDTHPYLKSAELHLLCKAAAGHPIVCSTLSWPSHGMVCGQEIS